MKKLLLVTVFLCVTAWWANAQISKGGTPPSFNSKNAVFLQKSLPTVTMEPVNVSILQAEDLINDLDKGIPWRFGQNLAVNLSLSTSGQWEYLPNGDKLWRLRVYSQGAYTLNFGFSKYNLPDGATLFFYNENHSEVLGSFTSANNTSEQIFATTLIPCEAITIEYYEPANVAFSGELVIDRVTHGYRNIFDFAAKNFGDAGSCQRNVACSPDSVGWSNQIRSVCMLVVGGSGFCTGALINNTAQDNTPYVLTANHCSTSNDFASWIFWFNWQSATCTNPGTSPAHDQVTTSGSTLKARNAGSDFCIVQMNDTPCTFNPYYSGWSRSTTPATSACGIHHPSGDIKKISLSTQSAISATYSGVDSWQILWGTTCTEPGSSGSPIYDQNHRIIGQLYGGPSYCGAPSSDMNDYYGKLSTSWTGGGTSTTRLSDWLDPTNSGVTSLDGRNCNSSTSDTVHVDFSGTPLSVPVGGTVNFTDLSTGNPTSWEWTFEQGTPASSNVQNPTGITYNIVGTYYVKLKASNATTSDSLTKSLYVDVYDPNAISVDFSGNPLSIPPGGTVNFTDLSTGNPTSWEWTFEQGTPASSTVQNPTGITYNIVGTYYVKLKASNATTSDSLTKNLYIEVYDPLGVNCDFIGAPTCIVAGDSVNFTDLSTNTPTTWLWKFTGGTPDTAIVKNPQNILYDTPGVYNVYLHASNSTSSDTLTKLGYITVMDPSEVPNANFIVDYNNIPAGTSINFTNQSTGLYDSLQWYFSGAVPPSSTSNNPASITYNAIGVFDVTLILYSSTCNNDTLIKPLYIHVFDPAIADSVHADFHATTSRLLTQGGAVNYEDLSTGNIMQWKWSFPGGTPLTSTAQSPQNIVYASPGIFDVCLIVSNSSYSDTLCKTEYIVVSDHPWPEYGFCDTVTNILPTEHPLTFMHLTPQHWGYFPGHNQLQTKYYAEKVTNYTFSEISGLIVPPVICISGSPNDKVTFIIWDVNNQGLPGNVLGTKNVLINTFVPFIFSPVMFDTPVQVNGQFFVGFQLYYNNPDTFVVYMSPNRPNPIDNHLYLKKNASSVWQTPTQFFQDTMPVNVSLAISVIGCLVGINVEEINMDSQISVYPNPTSDKINIELKDFVPSSFNCNLYDLTGRKIKIETFNTNTNLYEIDVSKFNNGIYLLEINVNNQRTVKKVSIIK